MIHPFISVFKTLSIQNKLITAYRFIIDNTWENISSKFDSYELKEVRIFTWIT